MVVTKFVGGMTEAASIPVAPIMRDWFGARVAAPPCIGCGIDPVHFHFRARRGAPARVHPDARPGEFSPNLWQHDAAEFFLVHPDRDRYLEFNLAPNGAWWSCEFTAPRQRTRTVDEPFPGVTTTGRVHDDSWEATASLPLDLLRDRFQFGPGSRLNVTATLRQPGPSFLTACPLGPGKPDFHQPGRIPLVRIQSS